MSDPVRCGTCGAAIRWGLTPAGKAMPVNAAPDPERRPGSYALRGDPPRFDAIPVAAASPEEPVYMNHWTTCRNPPKRTR